MVRIKMKVVMLGEGRVGKTSLLQRFIHDRFDENCPSTQRAAMYASVKLNIGESVAGAEGVADLSIWDTAGQERYHALGPIYYRDAHGAVLVYDITDAESFEKVKVWLKELHQVVGETIHVVVVGNKIDLERERKVPKKVAEEWAAQQGAKHFTTSAKLGIRIPDAFQSLAEGIFQTELPALSSSCCSTNARSAGIRASSVSANGGKGCNSSRGNGGVGTVGAAPPRSRGVKVSLSDGPDGPVSAAPKAEKERGCGC